MEGYFLVRDRPGLDSADRIDLGDDDDCSDSLERCTTAASHLTSCHITACRDVMNDRCRWW